VFRFLLSPVCTLCHTLVPRTYFSRCFTVSTVVSVLLLQHCTLFRSILFISGSVGILVCYVRHFCEFSSFRIAVLHFASSQMLRSIFFTFSTVFDFISSFDQILTYVLLADDSIRVCTFIFSYCLSSSQLMILLTRCTFLFNSIVFCATLFNALSR
jgi:hypothetical protein